MIKEFDIVITANSPGELWGWVKPVITSLNKRCPQARIILVITPCQYASGRELEVARSIPGVEEVILPQEYTKWMRRGASPQGISFNPKGIVVFMGGDLFHGVLLSRKLKFPAIAYSENRSLWKKDYKFFMVPYPKTKTEFLRRGVPEEKIKLVGNLVVDSVSTNLETDKIKTKLGLDAKHPVISFMPGSRPFQVRFMTPFFLKTADLIKQKAPESKFIFALSPFVNPTMVEHALRDFEEGRLGLEKDLGSTGSLSLENSIAYINTSLETKVILLEKHAEALNISDLVVTVPGTNTAEAAILGKPMLVVFPLNKPELIPLEGLLGLAGNIPRLGHFVKRASLSLMDLWTKYLSQPNMIAGQAIVPELRGILKPKDVANKTLEILADQSGRDIMGLKLKEIMGEPGAANRVVDEILRFNL